jgi:peptidoglycan/LPS O-acetylase OafA/YrhL
MWQRVLAGLVGLAFIAALVFLAERDVSFSEHIVETFLCLVLAIIALAYAK